ncbi:MAG: putative phosphoribosyl transferase [Deltaproteobacteria bacterium ADurb.BinA179]|jgi:predicted alpha/beta-hydrolase family hydrolase|nr:dienelactone hydrolase family protein [Deltaproteobacteria bacterium]MDI9543739.1 dienelactone hydrolase family protein [Pseudomonadota bacterium]OPZ26431.1 MAG: putative phosphoribosyl transferase [Deltaproteobacteria bacterium ADurb.BinA179]HNU73284.1 dienelactone hydrolase family protein [Deltaproteobacteria bacterium]HOD71590.1 dienelactone hydrolase family protein [Deltaproteobacteria bacterium]
MVVEELLRIPAGGVSLEGMMTVPEHASGLVIFAHGAGSSRLSPRNTYVARILQGSGLGTLLFDLLTQEEDLIYRNRFDIDLISRRMAEATMWVAESTRDRALELGYFGASTGSAAALKASVEVGVEIRAIVSRGGRPDLVMDILPEVRSPTLFIVGGNDPLVADLNRQAFEALTAEKDLRIVEGAGHLFEEPGKLDIVAGLASKWFRTYLG